MLAVLGGFFRPLTGQRVFGAVGGAPLLDNAFGEAEIRVLLSIGVIPTDTMVLGMFVILESQPISTFCG